MVNALKAFKDAGDFDAPIREWEARPVAFQTYANLKIVMCTEYTKLNRQDATTARATGHASTNAVEEFAQATEELVAELTEKHAKQIEALIKANNDTMQQLTTTINSNKAPALATPAPTTRAPTAVQTTKSLRWAKNAAMQPLAHTVARSIQIACMTNAGIWRRMPQNDLQDGRQAEQRAPDGAWGPQ